MKNKVTTLLIFLTIVFIGLIYGSLGPSIPVFAEIYKTTVGSLSIIFTIKAIGGLIGSIFGARLFDKYSGHKLLAIFIFLLGLCLISIPFVPAKIILYMILGIMGLLESPIIAGGNILLLNIHKENPAPFINGMNFTFGIGAFISPMIIAASLSWSETLIPAYLIIAIPILLFIPYLTSPSPTIQKDEIKKDGSNDLIKIILFAVFFFFYSGLEVGFVGLLPSYGIKLGFFTQETAPILSSVFFFSFAIGRLITIPISLKISSVKIVLANLIFAISFIVLLQFPIGKIGLLVVTAGLGVSLSSIFPTMFTIAGKVMTVTGKKTGVFIAGANVGIMTLPWLMGKIMYFEPFNLFSIFTLIAILIICLLFVVIRKLVNRNEISEKVNPVIGEIPPEYL